MIDSEVIAGIRGELIEIIIGFIGDCDYLIAVADKDVSRIERFLGVFFSGKRRDNLTLLFLSLTHLPPILQNPGLRDKLTLKSYRMHQRS